MTGNSLHPISGTYQHHTDSALCVKIDRKDYWFPLSAIEPEGPLINYDRGEAIEFDVQEWILVKHGLDYLIEP